MNRNQYLNTWAVVFILPTRAQQALACRDSARAPSPHPFPSRMTVSSFNSYPLVTSTPLFVATMTSSLPGSRDLPSSQYDLSTYWGRVRHSADLADPR